MMIDPSQHLAELNIGRLTHPVGAPEVADFVDAIASVNAIAERSDGFVWRLKDDAGDGALDVVWDAEDPRVVVNLSVWTDVAAFKAFVFKTVHARFMTRRAEWFEPMAQAHFVMWPVPIGHVPDLAEARDRLERLRRDGPRADAFDWRGLKNAPPSDATAG